MMNKDLSGDLLDTRIAILERALDDIGGGCVGIQCSDCLLSGDSTKRGVILCKLLREGPW